MGYTTDFVGEFKLNKPMSIEDKNYLETFSGTRRMKRNPEILQTLHKGEHGLDGEYGEEGEFFARNDGNSGQSRDASIIEYNDPAFTQPSLWCQWVPNEEGTAIKWSESEKFYCYIEWIEYLIEKFFAPKGYVLNGEVEWEGEDQDDIGTIVIEDNSVSTK